MPQHGHEEAPLANEVSKLPEGQPFRAGRRSHPKTESFGYLFSERKLVVLFPSGGGLANKRFKFQPKKKFR